MGDIAMKDDLVSPSDAMEIGLRLVEMADRVRDMQPIVPGTTATWHFEIDDTRYCVVLSMASLHGADGRG